MSLQQVYVRFSVVERYVQETDADSAQLFGPGKRNGRWSRAFGLWRRTFVRRKMCIIEPKLVASIYVVSYCFSHVLNLG